MVLIAELVVKCFNKHRILINLIPITLKKWFLGTKKSSTRQRHAVFKILQAFKFFFSIIHILFSTFYRFFWWIYYTSASWIICLRFKYQKQIRWNTVLQGQQFYTWQFTCFHQYALSFKWKIYNVTQQNTTRCEIYRSYCGSFSFRCSVW